MRVKEGHRKIEKETNRHGKRERERHIVMEKGKRQKETEETGRKDPEIER